MGVVIVEGVSLGRPIETNGDGDTLFSYYFCGDLSFLADRTVTKVTFHLPPTATHPLGEWTLPSHALVLCSSDVPDEVIQ